MDTTTTKTPDERELRRMAAVSRMTPLGSRDQKGRLLPLRYRAAARDVARLDARAR